MNVGIIGGGAAGFFAAISVKENYPDARVVIFEKSRNLLSKVKVSGGGRCNVTNGCASVSELCKAYPRGGKSLKNAFHNFNNHHTIEWFESRGVPLVTQEDGCVFPVSQNAQSIVDCLLSDAHRLHVEIVTGTDVAEIRPLQTGLELHFAANPESGTRNPECAAGAWNPEPEIFDKVIVTTGGSPNISGLKWLEELNHRIEDPVPSLFTFNMPEEPITRLMGIVADNTLVTIQGTKYKSTGPLLITHWGMSGPAVLKLSSFGARLLNEMAYEFKVQVNWVNEKNNDVVTRYLDVIVKEHANKILSNFRPYSLPERLWFFLLEKSDLPQTRKWGELGKKGLYKLTEVLTNDVYAVHGKAAFKDEFVTCGGVSLPCVDMNSMQSKVCKNLYFAGEVLDIDAITGGFNLQAAWTTGFLAGRLL